ncbi:hypothetical protein DVK02_08435 [Halobellus sp. Atlit-31R]|nr:hypothetical protein DVK02_08435 [Halobellus sp. Atlit-31R]
MVDVRTLAAAVLGVALGLVFLLAPEVIVRVQTAGRLPQDRHGRYGEDGVGGDGAADSDISAGGDRPADGDPPTGDDGTAGSDGGDRASDAGTATTGTDAGVPTRWRRLVRAAGAGLVAGGLYFGWTLV